MKLVCHARNHVTTFENAHQLRSWFRFTEKQPCRLWKRVEVPVFIEFLSRCLNNIIIL